MCLYANIYSIYQNMWQCSTVPEHIHICICLCQSYRITQPFIAYEHLSLAVNIKKLNEKVYSDSSINTYLLDSSLKVLFGVFL